MLIGLTLSYFLLSSLAGTVSRASTHPAGLLLFRSAPMLAYKVLFRA